MEKEYKNPEQEQYIKEKLFEKYGENLDAHGITVNSNIQICNMAEFLIAEHPEKYAKSMSTENDYRNDENLKKIYAVIDKEKKIALIINTNEKGKIPEGEFGVYDLENHKFELTNEKLKEKIRENVRKMSNGILTAKEEDEMVNDLMPTTLDDMDKMATIDHEIENKTKKAVSDKIDEKNAENGKTEEERADIEKNANGRNEKENTDKDEKEAKSLLSPEMLKQAYVLGYTKVKGVVVAKGSEAARKIEGTSINKNGGNVTIVRLADSNVGKESDKFLVFQGDKLVVPGNKDEEINDLLGTKMRTMKNGALVKPLEIEDEEQFIQYDKDGMSINIKLYEGKDLSVEDLQEYKKEVEENIAQFSKELYTIESSPLIRNDAEKDRLYIEANERFNIKNAQIAKECNINFDDMEEVNLVTDERTKEQVDKETEEDVQEKEEEIDAWEVPGRRQRGE